MTREDSGQAVVELALTLSILLMILLGALDLGRAFFSYITIINAAREGARVGAVYQRSDMVAPAARREASANGLNPLLLNVQTRSSGGGLIVTVTYPFDLIVTGFLPFSGMTLSATATMMIP